MGGAEKVEKYLKSQLDALEGLATEEKALDYHNHCLKMLEESSNKPGELSKMLADVEGDTSITPLTKSDVVKQFAELCLVLRNASEQNETLEKEDRKAKANEYGQLFEQAESVKNNLEYAEAKKMGFAGTFEDFVAQMS